MAWTSSQKLLSALVEKQKGNMKKRQMVIFAVSLAGAMSASAAYVVEQGGLPNTQPSTDLTWSDQESSANPSGGYMDAGGSFSIGGSGTYTVTGITVWDVINTGAPTTGLSLLNASGSTISSGYTATPATYGNGQNYNPGNPDDYPPATLYKVVFTVNETLSAGSYQFFLDGPLTLYPNGNYYNSFLLFANYGGPHLVPWLENIAATDGSSLTVGTFAAYGATGDAYVQVVPEPTTMMAAALLLLPFGASTLRILRKRQTA